MIPRRTLLQAAAATSLLTPLTARADESGTLTVALSNNPVTCDPINLSNHDMQLLSQTIWENLVEYDINGILKPQLAKALPQVSADKLIYTFDLRDDVFFQNGQKLTSEDVKYSFEYMLDPAHKAARAPIFNRLSHVETDGPYRCHVVLKEPYAPWVYFLTEGTGHRGGHIRGMDPKRLHKLPAQSELLAEGSPALGSSGGEVRSGRRDKGCLPADRPGRHHRRTTRPGFRQVEDPERYPG
jgi:ABC-type transport system substrate-binding protein